MKVFTGCLATALLTLMAAGAAAEDLAFGVRAGTLGVGVEARWNALPWLDVRGGLNGFDYHEDGSQAGINYDGTLRLRSLQATANAHLPLSPLRVTAGLVLNDNELRMKSEDNAIYEIGGETYSAAEAGTLQARAAFNGLAPYVGLGYDLELAGRWGLNFDVGVLFQGEPSVTLTSNGQLRDDPAFVAALERERLELADDVDDLETYPVATLAFYFNFL